MATMTSTSTATVRVIVNLPESVIAEYDAQAQHGNTTLDKILAARLTSCVEHTASKPLYFGDRQRQELETLLGRNVLHTQDAILQIRNAMSVRVQKVIISLKLNLLQKLKTRCIGMEWEQFLEQRVTHALEQYVGMR